MSRGFHASWWQGTAAERGAFSTALLAVPFFWYETDTRDTYQWDGVAWLSIDVGGSGVANQVAYWTGPSVIAGDAGFTYNAGTDTVTVGAIVVASGGDVDPTDASGQDLGDATHRWDLYTQGVFFGGATGTNIVTLVDNLADAFHILDAGAGDIYLKIVTTTGSEVVIFNEGGDDVDFRVETVGSAHTFFVEGSTNRVGILTSGPLCGLDVGGMGSATFGGGLLANTIGSGGTDVGRFYLQGSVQADFIFDDSGAAVDCKLFQMVLESEKARFRGISDAIAVTYNFLVMDMATGYVSVGAVAPTHLFQVSGASGVFDLESSDGHVWMDFSPDGGTRAWAMGHDAGLMPNGFFIYDSLAGKTPFKIYPASHDNTLVLREGDVGVNTLTPDARFQVVGDFKAGDDNTNFMNVGVTGDVTFVGGAGLPFGSFWGNEIAFTVAGGTGTFKEVVDAGITVGQTHLATFQNNKEIEVSIAGMYLVNWSMSLEADSGAGKHLLGAIGVDVPGGADALVAQDDGQSHVVSVGADENTIAGTAILDLVANSQVGLMVTIETDDTDVTVQHISLSIVQIGGT